jgi:hypothetical protein
VYKFESAASDLPVQDKARKRPLLACTGVRQSELDCKNFQSGAAAAYWFQPCTLPRPQHYKSLIRVVSSSHLFLSECSHYYTASSFLLWPSNRTYQDAYGADSMRGIPQPAYPQPESRTKLRSCWDTVHDARKIPLLRKSFYYALIMERPRLQFHILPSTQMTLLEASIQEGSNP